MPLHVSEKRYKLLLGSTTFGGVTIFAFGTMVIMDYQTWIGVPVLILGITIGMLPTTNLIHVRPEQGGDAIPGRDVKLGGDGKIQLESSTGALTASEPPRVARKVRRA